MKLIRLTQGQFAKVSDRDYSWINSFKWCAHKNPDGTFYAVRRMPRSRSSLVRLHRFIMHVSSSTVHVDHRNHDTLDCQRGNLRRCSRAQNMRNRRGANKNSKLGIRGISSTPSGKWRVRLMVDGAEKHIGIFHSLTLARSAYIKANRKYFEEFGGIS